VCVNINKRINKKERDKKAGKRIKKD